MDSRAIFLLIITFLGWGLGTFFSKLATDKIGANKAAFWDIIAYFISVILFYLASTRLSTMFNLTKSGFILAVLAGLFGAAGFIGFYSLLAKSEASTIIPLTALYPILGVILGIFILHESVTATKIIGITLSLAAIYLLNK